VYEALLADAMAAPGLRTKREVIEAGLRLLGRHGLLGRIGWEGDLDRERMDTPDEADRSA
jgi:hypothetical protein